jgi:hypothetical protein
MSHRGIIVARSSRLLGTVSSAEFGVGLRREMDIDMLKNPNQLGVFVDCR